MKLVGLMPVRNEAWCLDLSLRVALKWCDLVICADHGSTDESREIMERTGNVTVRDDRERDWREMEQRQMLLEEARAQGATHIAMIDADEVLTANCLPMIRRVIEGLPAGGVLQVPGYNLRGTTARYHANGIWGNRWFSLAFCDAPHLSWAGDRFHSREPNGVASYKAKAFQQRGGGVLHLWGVSEGRLRAKHALYKITERLRWPDKPVAEIDGLYNLWRSPDDARAMYPNAPQFAEPWTFAAVPEEWTSVYPLGLLDPDQEPWQIAECRRLMDTHGRAQFLGLDLFGVA